MPTVDPARLAAALERLGLTELQAQSLGVNLHPDHAPEEVRGLLNGSEPLGEVEAEEAPVEKAPEVAEEPAEEPDETPEEPAEEAEEADEAPEEEAEAPAEAPEVENPAEGVNVDAFEALAKDLTDEQLTAALADNRKGIQVIAQTELDERA